MTNTREPSMFSKRKSLTRSIRDRLSRSSSSETFDAPPTPPLPHLGHTTTQPRADPSRTSASPPTFPSPPLYAACYCEENVYHLLSHLSTLPSVFALHAVFISNASKTVLLYNQSASTLGAEAGWPVVWDYHVVAVVSIDGRSWVYDYDSILSSRKPIAWAEYWNNTCVAGTPANLRASFRCVPAKEYLENFASDRSHMRQAGGWSAPPPTWDCIQGCEANRKGVRNNLMSHWVDVRFDGEKDGFGRVWASQDWLMLSCVPPDKEGESGSQTAAMARGISEVRRNGIDGSEADQGKPKGGRIASPLFPAYLHASQQNRVQLSPPPTPTGFAMM